MRKAGAETGSTYDRECGVSESRGWAWATYRVAGVDGFRATVWECAPLSGWRDASAWGVTREDALRAARVKLAAQWPGVAA